HRFSGAQVAKAIPSRWRARHRRAEQLARTRRIGRPPLGRPARELIAIRVDRDRKYEMGDEGDGCFYDLLRLPTARRGAARPRDRDRRMRRDAAAAYPSTPCPGCDCMIEGRNGANMKRTLAVVVGLVIIGLMAVPAHAKCRSDCKQAIKSEFRACKAACPRHKPGKSCRA